MSHPLPPAVRDEVNQVAFSALFGGGLLAIFGLYFWRGGLTADTNSSLYNASVALMVWVPLIGGPLMLAGAALLFVGLRPALLIDALLTVTIGGLLLLSGLVQVGYSLQKGLLDFEGLLLLIFGGMFLRSGMGSWRLHAQAARTGRSALAGGSGHPPAAGGPVPPSGGLKEEARERLLQAKQNARSQAVESAVADNVRVGEPDRPATPTITRAEEPNPADKSPVSPIQPDRSYGRFGDTDLSFVKLDGHQEDPPAVESEPPETGFLAELGREDDERK